MPKNSLNVSLKGADDIFSTEESRQEQQREQVQQIPIGELFPFKNHPFKVLDDESMQRTVESVEQYGVLSPLIARPRPEGGYEIISGHRRQHAAQLAGLDTLPTAGLKAIFFSSTMSSSSGIRLVRRMNRWTVLYPSPASSATRSMDNFDFWTICPEVKSDLAP